MLALIQSLMAILLLCTGIIVSLCIVIAVLSTQYVNLKTKENDEHHTKRR